MSGVSKTAAHSIAMFRQGIITLRLGASGRDFNQDRNVDSPLASNFTQNRPWIPGGERFRLEETLRRTGSGNPAGGFAQAEIARDRSGI
jgi:hypothetical protein